MATQKIAAMDVIFFMAIVSVALTTSCFAAIAWEKVYEDPEFPGQCTWGGKIGSSSPEAVIRYQQGETWDIGDCIQARCLKLTDGLFIQYASCGVIGVEPPCITVPGNRSLPYPNCCPRPWCPELPTQLIEDPSITTNDIEAVPEETESYYQSTYQLYA